LRLRSLALRLRRRSFLLFLALAHHDGQVAERLQNPRAAAAGAGMEAPHHQALADAGLGDDQTVDVELMIILGIGDRRLQHLAHILGDATLGEGQFRESRLDPLAADQTCHQTEFPRADPDVPPNGHRLVFAKAGFACLLTHGYFFAFLSEVWPWKVRVGANSPSLCPTISSVTSTGMNLLPLCTPKVRPTNCGMIVERRDQVLM